MAKLKSIKKPRPTNDDLLTWTLRAFCIADLQRKLNPASLKQDRIHLKRMLKEALEQQQRFGLTFEQISRMASRKLERR